MKACLYCQKEYESKREASKFCSDKCRVYFNRKNPKQTVSRMQVQVMYNTMLEMMGKFNDREFKFGPSSAIQDLTKPTNEIKPYQQPQSNYAVNIPAKKGLPTVSPEIIMQRYLEEKRECQDADMWAELLLRIDNDDRLTLKQKLLIKNTP